MSSSSNKLSERDEWQLELEKQFVGSGVDSSLIAAIVHEDDQTYDGAYSVLTVLAGATSSLQDDVHQREDKTSSDSNSSTGPTDHVEAPSTSASEAKDEEEKVEQLLEEWKLVEKESMAMENLHLTDEEEEEHVHEQARSPSRGEREAKRLGEGASKGTYNVDSVAAGEEGITTTLSDSVILSSDESASGLAFLIHAFPSRTPIYLEEMLKDEGGNVEQVIDTLTVMEMIENGDFEGDSESEVGVDRNKKGLNYEELEQGSARKKVSKNERKKRRELLNASAGMDGFGRGTPQKINLTDIRQGGPSVSHAGRKVKATESTRKKAPVEQEDDATMAARLAAEERTAAGLPPQGEEVDAIHDNDWLFSNSILDQLSFLLGIPDHMVRSAHNSSHFNLRATVQRLIHTNCIEYPTLASLDEAGKAPSGTASTIVDGLAVLLPFKARGEVERAFRGTKGRQDATLDLVQLIDVVEKSAVGEKSDILDPMKASRGGGASRTVTSSAHSQQASNRQGRFTFVGDDEVAPQPSGVAYSQITKRSMKNGGPNVYSAARQHALDQLKEGAPSVSYPFHSAHIDASSSSQSSSHPSSNFFDGVKRNETKSEAEKLAIEYRSIAQEYQSRREENLRQAAHAYRSLPGGGANKQLRGAAAWVYADEARRLDAKARAFSLKAAQATVRQRMMENRSYVSESSSSSSRKTSDVVDLHGLTVHQSLSITKEALSAWWSKSSSGSVHPLYIVTGVGRHSRGNVAVIRPAILKMLQRDGWIVSEQREGQIKVQGLR
jgi:DNA-nicking Smr family endonuclease